MNEDRCLLFFEFPFVDAQVVQGFAQAGGVQVQVTLVQVSQLCQLIDVVPLIDVEIYNRFLSHLDFYF